MAYGGVIKYIGLEVALSLWEKARKKKQKANQKSRIKMGYKTAYIVDTSDKSIRMSFLSNP